MNRTTKTVVGWVAVCVVIAVIVLGGNYLIYTYIGIWNYIGLSIVGSLVWILFQIRIARNNTIDMEQMAKAFIHINKKP